MVKSGQVCADAIVCKDGTGALATPSVGPAGTLYVNGVANGATVTITGANPYKWSVTLPTLAAGDLVAMYITATIATIATAEFVWRDVADTVHLSNVSTELAKVPKSDSTVTWNATALASVATQVSVTLNAAIPGSPTADSMYQRVKAIDDLTQASGAGDLAAILTDTAAIVPPPIVL